MPPAKRKQRFLVASAAVVLCAACAGTAFAAFSSSVRWVQHSLEVQRAIADWRAEVLDAETGVRGYLLSGGPQYLEPYARGITHQPQSVAALRGLVADNAVQRANVDEADRAAVEALSGMRELLEAPAARGGSPAWRFSGGGAKQRIDAFGRAIDRIDEEEERLLAERTARERRIGVLSVLGILLFAAATGYVAVLAQRARREADLAHALAEERGTILEFQQRFLAVLGHDLRNPLNSIRMTHELLLHDGPSSRLAGRLERAQNATTRMGRMIDQILDFTRSRIPGGFPLKPKPVDLGDLVRTLVAEAQAGNPERSIEVSVAGAVRGQWDEDRLGQVVSNLLGNASAHGAPGQPIRVEVRGGEHEIELAVSNGGDIQAEVRGTLFDPFRKGERETKGSAAAGLGLGLYISNQIVRQHGGSIEAASSDGHTCFTVRLPVRTVAS